MLLSFVVNGQVGIGTASPDPSAMLDIRIIGNNKGLLIPRITQAEKNAITAPAAGLLVFQTDVLPGFFYYTGTSWRHLGGVTTINGLAPQTNGNVALNLIETQTGTQADRLATVNPSDGLAHIVVGETDPDENGKIYIYSTILGDWTLTTNFYDTDTNTDNQNIAGSSFNALTRELTIGIEGGSSQTIDLSSLSNTGTDSQTISAALVGNILVLRPENTSSNVTVDLSVFNNSGTDSQTISAALVGNTLELRPQNTSSSVTVDLSTFNNSGTDSQTISAALVGNTLELRPQNTSSSVTVDLTALAGTGTDSQTISAALVGNTLELRPQNTSSSVTVDLSTFNNSGTDSQTISAALVGNTLELRPQNTSSSVTVDLSALAGTGTDSQTISAALVGNTLELRPQNTSSSVTVDLSIFNNTGTDSQTISAALVGTDLQLLPQNTSTTVTVDLSSLTATDSLEGVTAAGNTTTNGMIVTDGNLRLYDNEELILGTSSSPFRIYRDVGPPDFHRIRSGSGGDLVISDDNGNVRIQAFTGEESIYAHSNGRVALYYDNQQKFETTTTGATTSGTLLVSEKLNVGTTSASDNHQLYVYSGTATEALNVANDYSNFRLNLINGGTDWDNKKLTEIDIDGTEWFAFRDNVAPYADNLYDLGKSNRSWKTIYATSVLSDAVSSTTVTVTNLNIATQLTFSSDAVSTPPLQLNASTLNDGVGAFRVDAREADIFLNANVVGGTFSTVTFASLGDEKAAFGRNSTDDFYITVRDGGGWRNDSFVIDNSTGNISMGYNLAIAGSATINGGTAVTSDRRLKSEIQPLSKGLESILALKPKAYLKHRTMAQEDAGSFDYGFIAQEVQQLLPVVVRTQETEDKILALSYTALIPILTKAIQEQQKLIETNKDLVEKLAAENQQMREELEAIKTMLNNLIP